METCVVCFALTKRRCAGCTHCPLCSDACAKTYANAHHGAAACRYHKTTLRYFRSVPLHEVCAGSISGPKAVLGSVFVADAVDAIPATVSWIVDRLAAQMSSSPLTLNSHAVATLVSHGDRWSRAMLRAGHMPTYAAGADQKTKDAQAADMFVRLLKNASRMSVAQTLASKETTGGHVFFLVKPVQLKIDGFSLGLQVDVVINPEITNAHPEFLTCLRRFDPSRHCKSPIAVYKLLGKLHDTGAPVMVFPGTHACDHEFLDAARAARVAPLLSAQDVRAALS